MLSILVTAALLGPTPSIAFQDPAPKAETATATQDDAATTQLVRFTTALSGAENYAFTSLTEGGFNGGQGGGRRGGGDEGGAGGGRRGGGDEGGAGGGRRGGGDEGGAGGGRRGGGDEGGAGGGRRGGGEEGGGRRGGGEQGGRRGGGGEPVTVQGHYSKGLPLHVKAGEMEAYKDGDQVVVKNPEGEWGTLDSAQGGQGGRGGGRRGRGARGPQRMLSGLSAPHTLFIDFGKMVESVEQKSATEGGPTVFTGKLSQHGAETLGGGLQAMGRRGGGQNVDMEHSGSFTIEVTGGAITSAKFDTTTLIFFGEREMERTSTRTLTFSEVGKTTFEVPADALAHFEI